MMKRSTLGVGTLVALALLFAGITMVAGYVLRSWRIRDPQGGETFVALSNVDTSAQPDPAKFSINYQRDLAR